MVLARIIMAESGTAGRFLFRAAVTYASMRGMRPSRLVLEAPSMRFYIENPAMLAIFYLEHSGAGPTLYISMRIEEKKENIRRKHGKQEISDDCKQNIVGIFHSRKKKPIQHKASKIRQTRVSIQKNRSYQSAPFG